MIPEEIRDFETYIVAYSGGKDSTATVLWSLEHLPREKLRFVFCDTGAEWPATYEYLGYIERELGITIERIRAGDREMPPTRSGKRRDIIAIQGRTLFEKIRLRGKWPNPVYRYCTSYLKQWPIRLYVRELPKPLQLSGIRAEESQSRSERMMFDSQGNKTGDPMFYPVLDWSERQVWDYLRAYHILPNPVYNYATRCGCWCCIMGRDDEVLNFCCLHPDIAQKAADLEAEIGHNWRDRQSIGNLLRQARSQIPLFERQPRFEAVGAL